MDTLDQNGIMSYKQFCYIIGSFKYLEYIEPYGLGECLLNNDLFRMLEHVKSKNPRIYIDITTNGSLINEEVAKKLINIEIDRINISMDGGSSEIYGKIRKGGDFFKIKGNIKLIVDTRNKFNRIKPQIVTSLVLMKDNIEDLEGYVNLAKEIGVDEAHVQCLNLIWSREKKPELDEKIIVGKLSLAKNLAKRINVRFTVPAIYEQTCDGRRITVKAKIKKALVQLFYKLIYDKVKNVPVRCTFPWGGVYITHKGYVTPCCMIADPGVLNFGNIFETSFDEIWNCDKYKQFRYDIACGYLPDTCRYCFESRQGDFSLFCFGY